MFKSCRKEEEGMTNTANPMLKAKTGSTPMFTDEENKTLSTRLR